MSIEQLRAVLEELPPGPIGEDVRPAVDWLLASIWDSIPDTTDKSMTERKLVRAEDWRWDPPVLSFIIERHGATVLGSKYAEMQEWCIDVVRIECHSRPAGRRRLVPLGPKLDTKKLAMDVMALVQLQSADDRLTWLGETRVKVNVSLVIPEGGAKETVRGQRQRFRRDLEALMHAAGWRRKQQGTQLLLEMAWRHLSAYRFSAGVPVERSFAVPTNSAPRLGRAERKPDERWLG